MPKSKMSGKVGEELNRQFNLELAAAHSYRLNQRSQPGICGLR
jgi:hypothetical protein